MRKPYEKPMLYAETFELVEHISNCGTIVDRNDITTTDWGICLFYPEGKDGGTPPYFYGTNTACVLPAYDENTELTYYNGGFDTTPGVMVSS